MMHSSASDCEVCYMRHSTMHQAEQLLPSCCDIQCMHAGRPLPPLTNWIPGELRGASQELLTALSVSPDHEAVTGRLAKPASLS
jgi:hypothetical protein